MANIHRIGDYENQQDNYHNIRGNQQMMTMFGGAIDEDPRNENFLHMIKKSFCPKLKLKSFTTIICSIITILYITMLCTGGVNKQNRFLLVQENTLKQFGGNNPYDVKHSFAIYEWITSLILIADFYYYVIAIFIIFIQYSILESSQGYVMAIIVYFGSGSIGALFGDLCNLNKVTTYSETFSSIYGCVGFLIGYLILHWQKLDHLGEMKCILVCFIAMIIIFVLIFTLGQGQSLYYDELGQLGGFLGGMFIAMSFVQVPQSGSYELTCQKVGYGFLGLQVGLSIILLYSL